MRPKFFNARGETKNLYRASLEAMKQVQLEQLETFRRKAEAGEWAEIHRDHFDWYMFPIEDGSQSEYNVREEDVAELIADPEWRARYHESVALVAAAWGWDVERAAPIPSPKPGQEWTDWDVRLAKIIRSLWLFGQGQDMASMQAFARWVKPNGGLSYGFINLDEVYFMRLDDDAF